MMKMHVLCTLFIFYVAHAMPFCYEQIGKLKTKDTSVVYAECIDSAHAVLYRSTYPDVLLFARFGNSVTLEVDSIIDFNHGFSVYRSETDLIKEMGDVPEMDFNKKIRIRFTYDSSRKYQLSNPLLGRFANDLFIVDDNHVYELSLSRQAFDKVLRYHLAMDIREDCSDSHITRHPNPQKVISTSTIKVSFQDSSEFILSSNGSLNVHVVDINSCLELKGFYKNIQIDRVKGDGCKKNISLCD
ncbi:MAG: hypothetical protein M0P13_12520 [Fibrobacteraceae bacterium]|nr:hypothetical protein [Fibrobacteraceae bacterium]